MSNKELQEKRIKSYFVQSAMEIIKGEGLRALNVRVVSERAGYSFATLYNYFKDLGEVLTECINGFIDDCTKYVADNSKISDNTDETILNKTLSFVRYFVQYTGTYELLFIEKSNDIGSNPAVSNKIFSMLDMVLEDEWNKLSENNSENTQTINHIKAIYKSMIYDNMFWYFNRRVITDYKEFIDKIKSQSQFILELKG